MEQSLNLPTGTATQADFDNHFLNEKSAYHNSIAHFLHSERILRRNIGYSEYMCFYRTPGQTGQTYAIYVAAYRNDPCIQIMNMTALIGSQILNDSWEFVEDGMSEFIEARRSAQEYIDKIMEELPIYLNILRSHK